MVLYPSAIINTGQTSLDKDRFKNDPTTPKGPSKKRRGNMHCNRMVLTYYKDFF